MTPDGLHRASAANATTQSGEEAEIGDGVGYGGEPRREVCGQSVCRLRRDTPTAKGSEQEQIAEEAFT
jgi:hypothetical protein